MHKVSYYLPFLIIFLGVTFPSTSVTLSTTEGLPVNSTIGNAINGISGGSNVVYTIIGGNSDNRFHLVGTDTTLEIQNSVVLDYEALGGFIATSATVAQFQLTIQANGTNGVGALHVIIQVSNDNYADVKEELISTSLSEKFPKDVVFHVVETKVSYGLLTYEIATENMTTNDASKFSLVNSFSGSVQLATNAKWDYEEGSTATLYVKIKPFISGLYHLGSYQKIDVTITDVNDNSNNFTQSSYSFSVDESATIGTNIGTVKAIDSDVSTTNNKTVYYVLNNMFSNIFTVDKSSGAITVAGQLNYESVASYYLTICATDEVTDNHQNNPSAEARIGCVPVTISLNNVDDNTPQISPASATIVISEKIAGNATLHVFAASDADGVTPIVKYNTTLTPSTTMSTFTVSTAGVVTLNTSNVIDYEGTQMYDLYVYAEDGNSNAVFSTNAHLRVVVLDVNDNSPKFTKNMYEFSVAEDSSAGTAIGRVYAYDNDSSVSNSNIKFSLPLNPTEFSIDQSTGELTVSGMFITSAYITKVPYSIT